MTDAGNNRPMTSVITVTLEAGANTIEIHADADAPPDLDRLSLG